MDDVLFGLAFSALTLFCGLFVVLLSGLLGNPQGQVFAQRGKAEQRAYTLLKRWLLPDQIAQLERYGYFEVRGSHSGKRYRIRSNRNMNIDELDGEGSRAPSGASVLRGIFLLAITCWPKRSHSRLTSRPRSL